jgi:ADP-heptose:LPS heptosyltransferase
MAWCKDFLDTARVLQGLDVVISIDSAVAHLAGAMGKPVFVLLPEVPDWRWGLSAETTPWYPGMRLFRRTAQDSWQDVMGRLQAALSDMAELPGR